MQSFILGEEVAQFEKEFAAYCETKYCVALNSGTSALHLALLAAGVEAGDEVITTPNTFIATAEAISYTGAKPVFVDIDPATANIDPKQIERAITSQDKGDPAGAPVWPACRSRSDFGRCKASRTWS